MATSDIDKITARVNWIIGARGVSFDNTVSDDRFIQEEIRRAILETESELVRTLCEAYHPMRATFLVTSADLANEAQLPAHIGQVEVVKIKPFSAAGVYNVGEKTTRENIRQWRANVNNIFDTIAHDQSGSLLAGYFNITNETITFTGNVAQVKHCSYIPNYGTPALQVDSMFDGVLVSGAIIRLNKLGIPQALVTSYGQLYSGGLQAIGQGLMVMPDIDAAQEKE